jgi:hypothetical protein
MGSRAGVLSPEGGATLEMGIEDRDSLGVCFE